MCSKYCTKWPDKNVYVYSTSRECEYILMYNLMQRECEIIKGLHYLKQI